MIFVSVPQRFRRCKIKHVTKFSTGWTPATTDDEAYQGLNTWVTIGDLKGKFVYHSLKSISDLAVKEKGIPLSPKGSLLFSFKLSVGNVSFAAKDLYTNEAIATFRKSSTLSLNYAFYAFPFYIPLNASENIYGAKLLNQELIANAEIFIPDFTEQRQIAAYLNRETAKIDKLIAKQQKLIKLLQEKRQAVISQAVTKGLDPNVKMKDSGVEWLGKVPINWEHKALKYCLKTLTQGWSPQCESFPASGPDEEGVLKVGCVNGGTFSPEQNKRLPQDLEFDASLSLKSGDLLISRANTKELVGSAAVVPADFPNLFLCDKLYRLRFKPNYSPQFISYYLSTAGCREVIELGASGASASMQNISQDVILNLTVPAPQLDEQLKIVAYLERQLAVFEELKNRVSQSIVLMMEHRQALITFAVTGKIDVRGLVTDEEVAALDLDPGLETTEENFELEVEETDYITEEE
jgi:type I restriction enzyme, S subunit